jgi:hypothetical protein
MKTGEIIKEIERLPITKRIYVIEKAIQLIRKQEESIQMKNAVNELMIDYNSDEELTSFTNLDMDEFYEAR